MPPQLETWGGESPPRPPPPPPASYAYVTNCFLQLQRYLSNDPAIVSRNDSAEREGNFVFGGLLDRCKFRYHYHGYVIGNAISIYPGFQPTTREISSKPYTLCLCNHSSQCTASEIMQVEVYRGQEFMIPLLAKMQYGTSATIVTAVTSSTAKLDTYQTSQQLPDYCAPLSYRAVADSAVVFLVHVNHPF